MTSNWVWPGSARIKCEGWRGGNFGYGVVSVCLQESFKTWPIFHCSRINKTCDLCNMIYIEFLSSNCWQRQDISKDLYFASYGKVVVTQNFQALCWLVVRTRHWAPSSHDATDVNQTHFWRYLREGREKTNGKKRHISLYSHLILLIETTESSFA